MTIKSISTVVSLAAFVLGLAVVFSPVITQAQCNITTCGSPVGAGPGDINGDGFVNQFDGLFGYVISGDNPPASLCNAEINGMCNPFWPCEPTLGDAFRLLENTFFGAVDLLPCDLATEPTPVGDMYVYPEYRSVDESTPGISFDYRLYLKNDGAISRDLYAYTLPLEFSLVNGGVGGQIDSMKISYQYAGPNDAWSAGGFPHSSSPNPYSFLAAAYPLGAKVPVTIEAGSSIKLLDVVFFYTTGAGADNPRLEVTLYSDPAVPGHIPVISLDGLIKGAPQDSIPAVESQVILSMGCDCPWQSDFDEDGFLTGLDLSGMIDVLYAGDPDIQDPYCPSPRADFDCDGFSTSLDLGDLIDHLYAGDIGPCDPCTP